MAKNAKTKGANTATPVAVAKSNHTEFAATALKFAIDKKANDTSPVYFAHAFADDMLTLRNKVQFAVQHGDKMRGVVLDYWRSFPEGAEYDATYQALVKVKQPNIAQIETKKLMLNIMNSVNINLQRAIDTAAGIAWLKANKYEVNIVETFAGSNVYSCYVKAPTEIVPTVFNVTQLRTLGSKDLKAAIMLPEGVEQLPVVDLRKLSDTLKAGTPNADKGPNGSVIEPSKMTAAITNLDTSIVRLLKDNGTLSSGKPSTEAMDALWAMLDATLPDTRKAKARAKYNEGAAEEAAAA